MKSVLPSIREIAFNCPHCGAYTSHTWFELHATARTGERRTPPAPDKDAIAEIERDSTIKEELKERLVNYIERLKSGQVFLEKTPNGKYVYSDINNLHASQCFVCHKISIWVHEQLVFPSGAKGPSPNADLPAAILSDYEEASSILNLSPRGAAALLRLTIQKLCIHLGEKGDKIDQDIASLVKRGLRP